jgi:hypothetical protein
MTKKRTPLLVLAMCFFGLHDWRAFRTPPHLGFGWKRCKWCEAMKAPE